MNKNRGGAGCPCFFIRNGILCYILGIVRNIRLVSKEEANV